MTVLAVIAAYGLPELTRTVVADLAREPDVAILVVDNDGGYTAAGSEEVVRPGRNLGWLRACNLGLQRAARDGFEHTLLLNNDTRLSDGFVAGLVAAHAATGGLIAPVYDDDSVPEQQIPDGPVAADYVPQARERRVSVIDGTAFLLSAADAQTLGPLDERRFGRHGWGAMEDLCVRARRAGVPVHVTERAYVSHTRAVTARAVNSRYATFAVAEMHYGLARKWGRSWSLLVPGTKHVPMTWRGFGEAAAWHWLALSPAGRWLQRPPSAPAQPGQEAAPDPDRHVERDEQPDQAGGHGAADEARPRVQEAGDAPDEESHRQADGVGVERPQDVAPGHVE